jgi:hypothetical protein
MRRYRFNITLDHGITRLCFFIDSRDSHEALAALAHQPWTRQMTSWDFMVAA